VCGVSDAVATSKTHKRKRGTLSDTPSKVLVGREWLEHSTYGLRVRRYPGQDLKRVLAQLLNGYEVRSYFRRRSKAASCSVILQLDECTLRALSPSDAPSAA